MDPESYPGEIGETIEFLQLKLSVRGGLRDSVMLTGDTFSHDCGAASLHKLVAVPDVATEIS